MGDRLGPRRSPCVVSNSPRLSEYSFSGIAVTSAPESILNSSSWPDTLAFTRQGLGLESFHSDMVPRNWQSSSPSPARTCTALVRHILEKKIQTFDTLHI